MRKILIENCENLGFPRKISAFWPFFDNSSLDTHQDVIDGNEKLDEFPFCSSDESDDSELSFCKRSWIIPLILIFEYVVALLFNFFQKITALFAICLDFWQLAEQGAFNDISNLKSILNFHESMIFKRTLYIKMLKLSFRQQLVENWC